MDDKLFSELLASTKEAKEILAKKIIPTFKDENEEREFWENNETLDYFDESKVKMVRFSNLKKTTKNISIRLP